MGKRLASLGLVMAILYASSLHADTHSVQQADPPERSLKLILGAGLSFGGDDLVKAEFENGFDQEIDAGSGYDLRIGAAYHPLDATFSVQATVGIFRDDIHAKNGDASFTRIPLELLGYYHYEQHRFGLGVAQYRGNKVKIEFEGSRDSARFDETSGLLVQYAYQYNPQLAFALRGAKVAYENDAVTEVNGDHLGVFVYFSL